MVTTEPAPTTEPLPIVRFGSMVEFAPMEAPLFTMVGFSFLHSPKDGGFLSLVNTACGPTNTLSSNTELSEQEESIERSKVMLHQYEYEQVEWSENPFPRHSKIK